MAKARIWGKSDDGKEEQRGFVAIYCPGCNDTHVIATKEPFGNGAVWEFNGNFERPTFSPSLKISTGKYANEAFDDEGYEGLSCICHSVITDGNIQFIEDTTHKLSGQTVQLPEIND